MASLALMVSIILFATLIIGPLSYLLSLFKWIPKPIIWILAVVCIIIGIWAILLPTPIFKIIGLVDLSIGLKIIMRKEEKRTQA